MKFLLIASYADSLINFRGPLLDALLERGLTFMWPLLICLLAAWFVCISRKGGGGARDTAEASGDESIRRSPDSCCTL